MFQCSGDDMNLVLTGGVTPATSPKVLSPGTLLPPPQPRLLAQTIAHQTLLARQHENLLLSLRSPVLPTLLPYVRPPSYPTLPMIPQQQILPTKRTYDRAFTPAEASPAKRPYSVPQMTPQLSLPMMSYASSPPLFSYANSSPMLSAYNTLPTLPTLPAGYGTALSAALPPTISTPFPGSLSMSMFPTYPYYPGV